MEIEEIGRKNPCVSCKRRLKEAGGLLRCSEWRRHLKTPLIKCSEYIGPFPELHIKLKYGPDYADSLAHARGK